MSTLRKTNERYLLFFFFSLDFCVTFRVLFSGQLLLKKQEVVRAVISNLYVLLELTLSNVAANMAEQV